MQKLEYADNSNYVDSNSKLAGMLTSEKTATESRSKRDRSKAAKMAAARRVSIPKAVPHQLGHLDFDKLREEVEIKKATFKNSSEGDKKLLDVLKTLDQKKTAELKISTNRLTGNTVLTEAHNIFKVGSQQ